VQWYKETFRPDDYYCATSETGYTNDFLSLMWLQHFDKYSKKHQLGAFRMLVFDGFGAHTTKEFIDYCDQAKIIPFGLLPHTSQWCQPLDKSCFQPYKWYHRRAVETAVRSGAGDFNKVEFLFEIQHIREQTFKPKTIRSGWFKAGLWPYNPAIILDGLPQAASARTVSPPPESLEAPTTPSSAIRLANKLVNRAAAGRLLTFNDLQRLASGTITVASELQVAKRDLTEVTKQAQKRQKRQQQDLRHVQKGGVLYARNAREAVLNKGEREALAGKKQAGGVASSVQPTQQTATPFQVIEWELPNNVSRD